MTEQKNPVLDLESQTTATAIDDDNLTSTMAAPALSFSPPPFVLPHPKGTVILKAYQFDGSGHFKKKEWDTAEAKDKEFCWFHLQINPPYVDTDACAHILIDSFCPPLKLIEIISLVNDGPFCSSYMDGAVLIFRIHSTANGDFPFKLAARVSQNSLITVSWGEVPRLLYNEDVSGGKHLFEVPQLERYPGPFVKDASLELHDYYISTTKLVEGQPVEVGHDLVKLFSEARCLQPVPTTMTSLVVHVIDTHVDLIRERIANIEIELNSVEKKWVDGDFEHNKTLMDGIKFSEMQLKLQHLLQVIADTEQVVHQVRDECSDIKVLSINKESFLRKILIRPNVLRESVRILSDRIEATQARLQDTIQSQQINRRVEIVSIVSMIFLPLSLITGVFSMQVSGVPWIGEKHPYGFRNVVIVGIIAAFGILMLYLSIPAIQRVAVRYIPKKGTKEKLSNNV